MKIFKNLIIYLSLLIFIGFFLVSCGKKSNVIDEDNNIYIKSFEYEVVENDSSVDNELAYSLSFDIEFVFEENVRPEEIIVRIEGKKSFQFTMDYCNTENITLSQSSDTYPFALLNYTVPQDVNSMESNVKIKITTTDLMDDINKFLTINCSSDDFIFIDNNNLTTDGYFKMNYSSDTGIYYEYNEFSESYKIVSVITKSKTLELPSIYNNHPVKTIDKNAFTSVTEVEELVLPDTLTSIPEGLLHGMSKLKTLSLPLVNEIRLAYLFGKSSYAINTTLKEVTITGGTCIGESAFQEHQNLTSITIPDSVTSIGGKAFDGCSSLTDIYYEGTIEDWCNISFSNSSSNPMKYASRFYLRNSNNEWEKVTSIEIPNTMTEIGYQFYGFNNIKSIVIPDSVTSIGESAFFDCGGLTSIIIPNSVTNIENDAFSGCISLTNVYYEGTIEEWYNISFFDYDSNPMAKSYSSHFYLRNSNNEWEEVTSIEIPDTTSEIDYQFYSFNYVTSLTIPDSVTSISCGAFRYWSSLTSITIPCVGASLNGTSNTHFGYIFGASTYKENSKYVPSSLKEVVITGGKNIAKSAFYGCSKLISIIIPNGAISIGESAFYECSSLTSISIPDSVTSIGQEAFYNCSSLTSITIPNSITRIEQSTFRGCRGLTSITISDSVTSIGQYAFSSCSGITSITILESVTEIGYGAFEYCSSLTDVTILSGLTSIGNHIFEYCIKLANITIPNSVTSIGEYAFNFCSGLKSITIPNSVTSIGEYAFNSCSGLTSITIPNSVTSIGEYAFNSCSGLTSITIPESLTNIVAYAFDSCSGLTSITIPNGVVNIGEGAFEHCNHLIDAIISSSVTNIENHIFEYCGSLKNIYYEGTKEDWNSINIGHDNPDLLFANIYYYSEDKPTEEGNYWHYVNGVVTKW